MRIQLSFLLLFVSTLSFGQYEDFNSMADVFLKEHVTNGQVNYTEAKTSETLPKLVAKIQELDGYSWNLEQQKAYHINVYNILVINEITKNFSISSPMDIPGFFDKIKHHIGGEDLTLNQLENDIIRPTYKDARLHFVLVCGAKGCPPITDFAYAYGNKNLNEQLENQTKDAINNPEFIKPIDGTNTIKVSEIFKWYADDFGTKESEILAFINYYRKKPFPKNTKIEYYPYNWEVNTTPLPKVKEPKPEKIKPPKEPKPKKEKPTKELKPEKEKTPKKSKYDKQTDNELTDNKVETPKEDKQKRAKSKNEPNPKKTKDKNDQKIKKEKPEKPPKKKEPKENTLTQTYNAGSLLKKGQYDITLFNSIYTETENNWLGTTYDGYRTTFSSSLIQALIGTSKSARFNAGFDMSLKASATNSTNAASNIWSPLGLTNTDSSRAGIAYIAPKIKFTPFKSAPDFSIQSTLIASFAKHPEGGNGLYWLEWNRYIWWNQFYYSKLFAKDKFQLFTEVDLVFRFKRFKEQTSHLDIPLNLFLSYFPTKKTTVYVMTQHVPRFVNNPGDPEITDWVIGANYTQSGVGFKYQVNGHLNIELLYSNFWNSKNNGLGETYNVGIKYVR